MNVRSRRWNRRRLKRRIRRRERRVRRRKKRKAGEQCPSHIGPWAPLEYALDCSAMHLNVQIMI